MFDNNLVKIGNGSGDKGAYHRALDIARKLLKEGAWDGEREIYVNDAYSLHDKLFGVNPMPVSELTEEHVTYYPPYPAGVAVLKNAQHARNVQETQEEAAAEVKRLALQQETEAKRKAAIAAFMSLIGMDNHWAFDGDVVLVDGAPFYFEEAVDEEAANRVTVLIRFPYPSIKRVRYTIYKDRVNAGEILVNMADAIDDHKNRKPRVIDIPDAKPDYSRAIVEVADAQIELMLRDMRLIAKYVGAPDLTTYLTETLMLDKQGVSVKVGETWTTVFNATFDRNRDAYHCEVYRPGAWEAAIRTYAAYIEDVQAKEAATKQAADAAFAATRFQPIDDGGLIVVSPERVDELRYVNQRIDDYFAESRPVTETPSEQLFSALTAFIEAKVQEAIEAHYGY